MALGRYVFTGSLANCLALRARALQEYAYYHLGSLLRRPWTVSSARVEERVHHPQQHPCAHPHVHGCQLTALHARSKQRLYLPRELLTITRTEPRPRLGADVLYFLARQPDDGTLIGRYPEDRPHHAPYLLLHRPVP